MGKEPFFKINFRRSPSQMNPVWDIYTNTYGTWMENAFQNQKKAKKEFLSVLDFLHNNDPKSAVQILDTELKALCKTEEDKTAWLFFMGLAHETMEQYAKAFLYFTSAAEYEQEIPAIYQKSADCAYRECLFGVAECNYQKAILLLKKGNDRDSSSLTILYASLASCFTMTHEYEKAEEALRYVEKSNFPAQEAQCARVLLYAALGEYEKAEEILKKKKLRDSQRLQKQIDSIRSGTNDQFSTFFVENIEIKSFWKWFSDRLETYLTILDKNQTEEISKMTSEISMRLKKVFPFTKRTITVSAYKNETYCFFVSDFYAKALSDGLTDMLEKIPEKVKESVRWIKIH